MAFLAKLSWMTFFCLCIFSETIHSLTFSQKLCESALPQEGKKAYIKCDMISDEDNIDEFSIEIQMKNENSFESISKPLDKEKGRGILKWDCKNCKLSTSPLELNVKMIKWNQPPNMTLQVVFPYAEKNDFDDRIFRASVLKKSGLTYSMEEVSGDIIFGSGGDSGSGLGIGATVVIVIVVIIVIIATIAGIVYHYREALGFQG